MIVCTKLKHRDSSYKWEISW